MTAYSARVASAVGGSSIEAPKVSAILLDAGGVLVFPEPANLLPPLREVGLDPDLATLERAHYHAMAAQDQEPAPPAPATWWRDYLTTYLGACGVAEARCEQLAIELAQHPRRYGWAHAGFGVKEGLRALAGLGLPMGVVSNSNGTVEGDLRRVGVCYAPGADGPDGDGPDGDGPDGDGPDAPAPTATAATETGPMAAQTATGGRRRGSRWESSWTPRWSAWPSRTRESSASRWTR